jgi:hypothetical protein
VLRIDHRDGDFHNNRSENLRLLCHSCHSQTANFAGRGGGRFSGVSDSGATGTRTAITAGDP